MSQTLFHFLVPMVQYPFPKKENGTSPAEQRYVYVPGHFLPALCFNWVLGSWWKVKSSVPPLSPLGNVCLIVYLLSKAFHLSDSK